MDGCYQIRDVQLDAVRGVVRRGDAEFVLRPQTLAVLLFLIRNTHRVVSKEELFQAVWNDTAVTDDAVVQCVVEIRKAFGDEVKAPRFIRTIPKVGYRFVATADPVAAPVDSVAAAAPPEPGAIDPPFQAAVPVVQAKRAPAAAAAAFAVSVAGVLYLLLQLTGTGAAAPDPRLVNTPGIKRVAIATFDDHTKLPPVAWLRHGLPDMLATSFSQLDGLAILGRQHVDLLFERSGVRGNAEARLDQALDAARRGNAEILVLGSFASLGDTLRIEARVYEVASSRLIASESATAAKPEEILIQVDTLASRVATRLQGGRRAGASIVEVKTNNLEAYRSYVLGLDKATGLETGEAIKWFQKAIEADPQFAAAYARIGYTYVMVADEPERAKPYLEKAFELSSRLTEQERASIAAWYSVAHADFAAAIDAYRRLLDRYPNDVEAYWRLGLLMVGEEKYPDAIAILERGLIVDPGFGPLYNTLGGIYLGQRDYQRSLDMYRRYVGTDPNLPNAHDSLGLAHLITGDFDNAIAEFERAIELSPTFNVAVVHLANAYYRLGRYRDAERMFDRYFELSATDTDRARGVVQKAWIDYRRGRRAQAWRVAQHAKERYGMRTEIMLMAIEQGHAVADAWLTEFFDETTWVSRGARLQSRVGAYILGTYALHRGNPDAAIARFKEAIAATSLHWNMEDRDDCLADAYLYLKRYAEAITEYDRVLADNPNRPLTRFNLARSLDAAGHIDRAIAEYRRALEQWRHADPDLPELAIARERIARLTAS